jgi:TraX protein
MVLYEITSLSARTTGQLKTLALVLMLADHIHLVFFDRQLEWLYWLSRLVFPIFALIVAQNLELHRASPRRYISRLLVYGIVAQPFYWLCFHVQQLNVLFTLASSISAWWILETLKARGIHSALRLGLALLIAASLPFLEFGWAGVLAVPVFAALMRRGVWWDWLAALVLAFGIVNFGVPWVMPLVALTLWGLASRFGRGIERQPAAWLKHAFYGFYPAHLAAIAIASAVINR